MIAPIEDDSQHVEGVRGGGLLAGLAPPAQFVEPERGQRPDQGEAGHQRIEQRQHRVAEGQPRGEQADHRIDGAQEHGVRRHGVEVVGAFGQRLLQVVDADAADGELGGIGAGAEQDMRMGHACLLTVRGRGVCRCAKAKAWRLGIGMPRAKTREYHAGCGAPDHKSAPDRKVPAAVQRTGLSSPGSSR